MEPTPDIIRENHYHALLERMMKPPVYVGYEDVNIIVEGETFKCHRLILSGASPYFDELFRSSEDLTKEVTLSDVAADIFEKVRKFIYTGQLLAEINTSNLFPLIRAAGLYKLTQLESICVWFMNHDEKNLNAMADDVLKMLVFAHTKQMKNLMNFLRTHIVQHFAHFSRTADYITLSFECLEDILDSVKSSVPPALHDVFLEGCFIWLRHQENLSAETRIQYSRQLSRKIDHCRISPHQTRSNIERSLKALASRNVEDVAKASDTSKPLSHAYISCTPSPDTPSSTRSKVRIYSQHFDKNFLPDETGARMKTWSFTGEIALRADFIRSVVVGEKIYSLSYSSRAPYQSFRVSTSISMYPYELLRLPPAILKDFDLCGKDNNIFVYNKTKLDIPAKFAPDDIFNEDAVARGMYVYKLDVGAWFPLPAPRRRFANACMTYDGKVVYLIGGSNSQNSVQVYDTRTQQWSDLSPTLEAYDGVACCSCADRIFLLGGEAVPNNSLEMYRPETGVWTLVDKTKRFGWCRNQQLRTLHSKTGKFLIFSTKLTENEEIHCYNVCRRKDGKKDATKGEWKFMSNDLIECVSKTIDESLNADLSGYKILDMIQF